MTQYDLFGPPAVEPLAPPTLTPRDRGHQAAEACAAKADTVLDGWTEQACQHVTEFARKALVNGDNPVADGGRAGLRRGRRPAGAAG